MSRALANTFDRVGLHKTDKVNSIINMFHVIFKLIIRLNIIYKNLFKAVDMFKKI